MRSAITLVAALATSARGDVLNDTDKAFGTEPGMVGVLADRVEVQLSIAGSKHCETIPG